MENAAFCDDSGNQPRIGDVKGGIVAFDVQGAWGWAYNFRAISSPGRSSMTMSLPVGQLMSMVEEGTQHVDWDAIVMRQNRNAAGADLIGGVAVGSDTVTAHQAGVDFALRHYQRTPYCRKSA